MQSCFAPIVCEIRLELRRALWWSTADVAWAQCQFHLLVCHWPFGSAHPPSLSGESSTGHVAANRSLARSPRPSGVSRFGTQALDAIIQFYTSEEKQLCFWPEPPAVGENG